MGPDLVPAAPDWPVWVRLMLTTHFDLVLGPFWVPGGADLVPTAPDWPVWVGLMLTTHFDLVSGPFWAPGGPNRVRFGPKCPFWVPRRSSEGPKRPDLVPTTPD